MGQKVNPYGFRLGVTTDWKSRWFADKQYGDYVVEDWKIRNYLMTQLPHAAISRVEVERTRDRLRVDVHTARPGIVIGRRGAEADRLRAGLAKITGNNKVQLNIQEIKQAELDAALIAQGVADQLAGRVAFRRAMKRAVQNAQKAGALGIRVQCSGRLGGSEMSRTEWYREGRVPLHTLRADIDYGFREARTPAGRIGVKVWIYRGDILPYKTSAEDKIAKEAAMAAGETAGQAPKKVVSSTRKRADEADEAARTPRSCTRPIPSSRSCSTRKRPSSARPASTTRPPSSTGTVTDMLMPRKVRHRKQHRGRTNGMAKGGTEVVFGEYGIQALEPGLDHRPPDRGRPYRHDPPHQAWRQGLDQHLPRQARHREAGRDPHGLGQGQPGALGRRRAPGPGALRAVLPRPDVAQAAIERAIQKLPIKARFVTREEAL